ncbi:MAG: type II toxin-antitoxin system VapC family toxin [bacterium]|nr:type II toxin-antitoxin system VapC family toxin [bacterium]
MTIRSPRPVLIVDASVVVAALTGTGVHGSWATRTLAGAHLTAPHLMPIEVANVLRRAQILAALSSDVATLAHADLLDLDVDLYPYEAVADRVWGLRGTLTSYDASYVALAERIGAPLATLDVRLARAPGPTFQFLTPPGSP